MVFMLLENPWQEDNFQLVELENLKLRRKWLIPCLIVVIVIAILFYTGIQRTHTFTLAERNGVAFKSEQIQPLFETIRVSGDCDTDVIFTDIETGETYTVGYITSGVSEKIKLQKGKWYTVEGAGNITVSPVNIRIE